jgi:diguanylate cyclase (GGDEF)-like protein
MRALIERVVISSTPTWRVSLAVFAATPFFIILFIAHGMALADPEIRLALHVPSVVFLQGVLAVCVGINAAVLLTLWPHRHLHDPVPRATLLVCLSIGTGYTVLTMWAGTFTAGSNLVLVGVLAIGLLLFDIQPMVVAYVFCVAMLALQDLGVVLGWWSYAPALMPLAFEGGRAKWWFDLWREFALVGGYVVLLSLLLLLFGRLDALHQQLTRLSYTDGLTGLANRRRFMELLEAEVARQRRTGRPLCVVLIDADHFKSVNDRFGHHAGDDVLRALARIMMGTVRAPTDLAARLGGEEFALILPDTVQADAEAVCARLRAQLSHCLFGELPQCFQVTVSIGVIESRGQDVERILQEVDQQLYRAKSGGRDQVCLATVGVGA